MSYPLPNTHKFAVCLFFLAAFAGQSFAALTSPGCRDELVSAWALAHPIELRLPQGDTGLSAATVGELAQFVADLTRVCGRTPQLFDCVSLSPGRKTALSLLGPTLFVTAGGQSMWSGKPLSNRYLWELWNQGAMFPRYTWDLFIPKASKIRARWEILNPAGFFRTRLRQYFAAVQARLMPKILAFQQRVEEKQNAHQIARDLVVWLKSESRWDELPQGLREKLSAPLASAEGTAETWDLAYLKKVLGEMATIFSDAAESESLAESVAALTYEALEQSDAFSLSFATGVIAVANYHDIGVLAAVSRPADRKYIQVVRVKKRHIHIALGLLVGVATGDSVQVKASHEGVLVSSALERVFGN